MRRCDRRVAPLDNETRAAVREGLVQGRRGEFVPDEEIKALWNRHGVGDKSSVDGRAKPGHDK